MHPDLLTRVEGDRALPLLLWRFDQPLLAIASGPLGGGIGLRHWMLNASVPLSYDRDDPERHLADLAAGLGLRGPGLGFLTAVDVGRHAVGADEGVTTWATVGAGPSRWAAGPPGPAPSVGTINIFAYVPSTLSAAALVNMVATITEAKVQALLELGYAGTGTPTDATCVLCPPDGPVERYGGPRSTWGARLARAAHQAVLIGDGNCLRT